MFGVNVEEVLQSAVCPQHFRSGVSMFFEVFPDLVTLSVESMPPVLKETRTKYGSAESIQKMACTSTSRLWTTFCVAIVCPSSCVPWFKHSFRV